jgi:hypothetical protein
MGTTNSASCIVDRQNLMKWAEEVTRENLLYPLPSRAKLSHMDSARIWQTVVQLSVIELVLLGCLTVVALGGMLVATAMYGRLVVDEWRANRSRSVRRKAWIEGHTKVSSAHRDDSQNVP